MGARDNFQLRSKAFHLEMCIKWPQIRFKSMNSSPAGVINDREKWKYKVAVTSGKRYVIVSDPPKVAVRSDKGTTNPVPEGTKVVLLCEVLARPGPHRITWYHEVRTFYTDIWICAQIKSLIKRRGEYLLFTFVFCREPLACIIVGTYIYF